MISGEFKIKLHNRYYHMREFLTVTSTTLGHEKLTQIIVDMHFWHCYERFMYQSIFIIARVDEHTLKYYDAEES